MLNSNTTPSGRGIRCAHLGVEEITAARAPGRSMLYPDMVIRDAPSLLKNWVELMPRKVAVLKKGEGQ